MHCPPPIFREVVLWDERERSNRVKNRCREGILYLNSAFPCEERSCTTFYTIKTQKVKIRKTWLMTKKGHSSEFLDVKMEISPQKNVIQKFWSAKIFPSPQTRRHVSAAASRNGSASDTKMQSKVNRNGRLRLRVKLRDFDEIWQILMNLVENGRNMQYASLTWGTLAWT